MKNILRIPLTVFLLGTLVSFQIGCKKEEQAPKAADSAKSVSQAPAPSGTVTLNDKAKQGQLLFYNTSLGKRKVACANCHTDGTPKTSDDMIRQGHPLAGVTSRPSTWNGMYKGADLKKNAYGASLCAAVFQHRADSKTVDKALTPDEVDALNEYLTAIATLPSANPSELKIQWAAKPTFNDDMPDEKIAKPVVKAIMKLPGDAKTGETVFAKSCATCHSMKDKKVGPPMERAAQDMNLVAQAVRFGSGDMPFYAKDVMSDQQIADALAYIGSQLGN
ncbi:MAG: cytochrome c [bacterium]